MNLTKLRRSLGIDTRQSEYTYEKDPRFGHVTSTHVADKWLKTTCGYCSVGCGMLVGIRDGKAVSVRGNPEHPVNLGKLCPKGLSEHHILDAPGRAKQPLLRKDGKLVPVSWDEALETMIDRFGSIQQKWGRDSLGVVGTGQLLGGVLHPRQAGAARLPHPQQRRQHHPLHGKRRRRVQALFRL